MKAGYRNVNSKLKLSAQTLPCLSLSFFDSQTEAPRAIATELSKDDSLKKRQSFKASKNGSAAAECPPPRH